MFPWLIGGFKYHWEIKPPNVDKIKCLLVQQCLYRLTKISKFTLLFLLSNQTIKAKLIIKSDKHHFAKYNGHGIMLTLNLIDWSGEITMTAFGDCVDKVFEVVEVIVNSYNSRFNHIEHDRMYEFLAGEPSLLFFQFFCETFRLSHTCQSFSIDMHRKHQNFTGFVQDRCFSCSDI